MLQEQGHNYSLSLVAFHRSFTGFSRLLEIEDQYDPLFQLYRTAVLTMHMSWCQ